MWKAIKRQIYVQRETFAALVGIMLGCWVFGAVVFAIAMHYVEEKVYFPIGACCALLGAGLMLLFFTFAEVCSYFNVELSMGSTRSMFFVSHFAVCLLEVAEIFALVALLYRMEEMLNRIQDADSGGIPLLPYLFRFGIPIVVLLVILASLAGALFMRFGRPVLVTVWFVWMFLCIGVPRLHHVAEASPDSVWGRIESALGILVGGVPNGLRWMLFAAVCAAGIAGTWVILRRQQVSV